MSESKQLKAIGKNTAEEFMETIIYMTAYDKAHKLIQDSVKDIDNPIIKEATESAINVALFGGIFMVIRYEEKLLEKAFEVAEVFILYFMGIKAKVFKKLAKVPRLRGSKLNILSKILGSFSDDGVQKAQVVSSSLNNFFASRQNSYQSGSLISSVNKTRENVLQMDRSNMMLGKTMADNYVNSLMFKLLTSSFTSNDKNMIRKILGRQNVDDINVEDLNKIGSFMFAKDDEGNITGLTEQFYSLISGLGYVVKKG
ncbi:hypothetical protein MNB_SM-7-1316 [hydrothermal vent metagenome]|uniref:Uncharacterized protein n=1 Tax=hydrothermal vent metagenome TaxID=652676 RepID=A0A1W1BXG9_9ZZZZ